MKQGAGFVIRVLPQSGRRQTVSPRLHLLLSVLLLSCAVLAVNAISGGLPDVALRGVAPADLALYEADPLFCRDHSRKIAVSQLNDDFCDCPDGSDEPGTSACPTGRFYCRNKGYHPISIFSSRVNDGICDCCDGSDEWATPGSCPNTCLQAGAAYRTQLAAEAAAYSEGHKVRTKYVAKAQGLREQWASQLEKAKAEKVKQEAKEKALKARKEAVEAAEKAQREWREQQEKAAKAAEPAAPEQPSAVAPEGAPTLPEVPQDGGSAEGASEGGGEVDPASEGTVTEEGGAEEGEEAAPEVPPLGEEDAAEHAGQLSAEELGRRVASRWTHNEEAVGDVQQEAEQKMDDQLEAEQKLDQEGEDWEAEARDEAEQYGEGGGGEVGNEGGETGGEMEGTEVPEAETGSLLASVTGFFRRVLPESVARLVVPGPPPQVNDSEVESVRAEWTVAQSKLTEFSSTVTDLETKLGRDYGPDDVFVALADECFEVPVKQYKYRVCMYDAATQEENGQSVRLGGWAGWLDNYSAFQFTNGQHCWNGPMRSLKVRLRCGPKNELSNINEPSRCEYTADLATPALCTDEATKAVKEELASAERIAKELKDEL